MQVQCPQCLIISVPRDPGATRWDCPCGLSYTLRRCSSCGVVSNVPSSQQPGEPWNEIGDIMSEIVAYGTAVTIEPAFADEANVSYPTPGVRRPIVIFSCGKHHDPSGVEPPAFAAEP